MTYRPGITVCIPSIPPRVGMLRNALESVLTQTHAADALSVSIDHHRAGAAITRTNAVRAARTRWVAMLDDDDRMLPTHLQTLREAAEETGADFVYSWFHVVGGKDPFPHLFGKVFDPLAPTHTTVTTMVKTELAQAVGYVPPPGKDMAGGSGEDWEFLIGCIEAGAKIVHVPQRTWIWNHEGGNTSGRNDRW